jgi:exodeoxyribonuclease-3
MAKFLSWNVNGLRSCGRQGFLNWFEKQSADVVCVQEIKAAPEQLDEKLRNPNRYHAFFHPAEKAGYSGVAVFTKREPLSVEYGIGKKEFDREGRVLTVEFGNFVLINSYFPNSQRDHARLPFKLKFCREFERFVSKKRTTGKTVIMCADWNIAHKEIDLKNPKSNQKNAGFLPEERAWMTKFLAQGFVDAFRHFHPDPEHYTWWSYRPGVRERNIGWRLDYFLTDQESRLRLRSARHQNEVFGSDHCPIALGIKD